MAATPWATIEQINTLTGKAVDQAARDLAAVAIELHIGLIEEVERTDISDRDRYWLKVAVCMQAAWLTAQPDYLERNAVASASQDGQSAAMGNPDWLTLAPLARKAIKRLSYRNAKTIDADRATRLARLSVLSEAYDDALPWRAM